MVLEDLLKQMVANKLTNGNLEDAEDFIQTAFVMNTPLCDVFENLYNHMEEEGDNYCFMGFRFNDCECKVEVRKIKE